MKKISLKISDSDDMEKISSIAVDAGMQLYHALDKAERLELARAACVYYVAAEIAATRSDDANFAEHRKLMHHLFGAAEIDLTALTRRSNA